MTTELRQAWDRLSVASLGIVPTNIVGQPNRQDAINLADDLRCLARHVDALVLEYGRYAQSTLGISQRMVDECFTDVLSGAIEGNATFILERTGEQLESDERPELFEEVYIAAHRARVAAE